MISVIINVYNGEKFIKKCIDSVVNQTYKDLEIIIVNDGSTDNTLSICKSYNDFRIRIITTENLGLSMSRNVGLDNAKGDYIYFVDVDDYIELDTIEYLYNLCKKYNTLISTCKAMDTYNYSFCVKNKKEKTKTLTNKKVLKDVLLSKNKAVCIWNKLIKRELFDNLRFENRIINDMAFTHKLIMKTDKIAYSNQIKYYYLRHKESITAKKASIERLIDIYNVYVERFYYVRQIFPNFIENNVALLQITVKLYLKNNKQLVEYLDKGNAIQLFKKVFSLKILISKTKLREKIKIILFRISPTFNKFVINNYLKLLKKKRVNK